MYSSIDGEDDDTVETIDMNSGGGMNYYNNRFGGIGGGGFLPGSGNMDRLQALEQVRIWTLLLLRCLEGAQVLEEQATRITAE